MTRHRHDCREKLKYRLVAASASAPFGFAPTDTTDRLTVFYLRAWFFNYFGPLWEFKCL